MHEPQNVLVQGLWMTNLLLAIIVIMLVLILIKITRRSDRSE